MSTDIVCKICNVSYDDDDVIMSKCDECNEWACTDCDNEVEDVRYCDTKNCWYCRNGRCFNNVTLKTYCSSCAPKWLIDKLKKQEDELCAYFKETERIHNTQSVRKDNLEKALKLKGLELRDDSKLCKKYIVNAQGDIDEIVETMCEMKWLFEYGNMNSYLDQVKQEWVETVEHGYIPDFQVFPEAKRLALETYPFPQKWPWLS